MLYPVCLLGALAVVETVQSADKVAGYTADTLKSHFCIVLPASAVWALVLYYAGKAADRVAVNRVVYRAIAYAALLHVSRCV